MSERLFLRLEGDAAHAPESGAPAGSLVDGRVPARLRRYLSDLLLYREVVPPDVEVLERVVPDGSVRLVFNLGDAPSANGSTGFSVEAIGPTAQPALVRLRGRIEGVSIALRPGAARALLGVPADVIADTAVHLDDLWHGEASRLLERLVLAPDDAARMRLFEAALVDRLARGEAEAPLAALRAARVISESGGRLPVREVARTLGVGERRLQQLFQAHVGLSPRAWGRLSRLHTCLRLLRQSPRPRWGTLALDAGFYDQAHLANEFRALCGLSPTAFLAAASGSSKTAA